jgi:hypothetical protein
MNRLLDIYDGITLWLGDVLPVVGIAVLVLVSAGAIRLLY